MSAIADASRPVTRGAERLLDALSDPLRREWHVVLVLLAYVGLWTLYGVIAKGAQDIHPDMSEQFVLARELAFGYPKHPPLAMLIVRLWFAVFPTADWAYYLLAMANAALALWIAWRLSARFLTDEKRVVGLALLTLVPFFNFHALKFNANTVLMPLWAAVTLFFLRSFETRRVLDAALAGVGAAAAMYGKYWSAALLLGLATAALAHPRRAEYFRSRAPWITVLAGGATLAPHLVWLVNNDFAPFSYAMFVNGKVSGLSALVGALGYLLGSLAYICVPLVMVFMSARPARDALEDSAWPAEPERRLAAAAFWATLILPALIAPAPGIRLTSLWSMPAWTLLPIMLLGSPRVAVPRSDAVRMVAVALAFPLLMVALSPAIGVVIHRTVSAADAHSSLLAELVERLWRETTNRPLKLFSSMEVLVDGVPFYLRDHPTSIHLLEGAATPPDDARIEKDGIVLLCPINSAGCLARANAQAERSAASKRRELEVSRSYLGDEGSPARYLVIAIPPR
jgi:4-amino-4-deoxy-L-arabinose transferase-like glycosyltransferase